MQAQFLIDLRANETATLRLGSRVLSWAVAIAIAPERYAMAVSRSVVNQHEMHFWHTGQIKTLAAQTYILPAVTNLLQLLLHPLAKGSSGWFTLSARTVKQNCVVINNPPPHHQPYYTAYYYCCCVHTHPARCSALFRRH